MPGSSPLIYVFMVEALYLNYFVSLEYFLFMNYLFWRYKITHQFYVAKSTVMFSFQIRFYSRSNERILIAGARIVA